MSRVSRAVEKGETQGFIKVAVDAKTKHILGAAISGPGRSKHVLLTPYKGATRSYSAMHIHQTVGISPDHLGQTEPFA
jgi:pyruvate/2-oxoglutarate dehydrogenase complex dihydrolipoamide dehydrogenase (E3) component